MIQVILASNRNYFYGLLATIASLLESNKANSFSIHIINGGLSEAQKRFLLEKTSQRLPTNTVTFHTLDGRLFEGFKTDYGQSYMTYARILVASFVEADRVIYLDTDLLVAADIRALWEVEFGACIVAAARDRDIRRVGDDFAFNGPGGDGEYFNAGVMVINLKQWRSENVQSELLRMITDAPMNFKWWDQTAMNVLFEGRVRFVESQWNTFADSVSFSLEDTGRIFHFVGETKPWGRYLNTPGFRLWRAFFDRHAMPRRKLFLDRGLAASYLEFVRHEALCRSRVLRMAAQSLIKLRAYVSGTDPQASLQRFIEFHTVSDSETNGAALSKRSLDTYVRSRWG